MKKIEIRRRATLDKDGALGEEMTVFCPSRAEAVQLDDCSACASCHRITVDAAGKNSFLVCDVDGRGLAAAEGWYRDLGPGLISDPHRVAVSELMTRNVICITGDVSLETARALLVEKGISGIPVVDTSGRPLGMISKTDLVRERYEGGDTEEVEFVSMTPDEQRDIGESGGFHAVRVLRSTVGEVMMPFSITLPETASVARAAALMAYEGIHRIPVVSANGSVVGMLSAFDVLRWLAESSGFATGRRSVAS